MDNEIIITGHKNPDTDTICSSIAYAMLKQKQGIVAKAITTGEINEETLFALQTFLVTPPVKMESINGKKVILVDHNESQQSPEGISKAEIIEVIDHHKIAFTHNAPIPFYTNPVGSTATLIYQKYLETKIALDKSVAGILLCAILSDTVIFKSPTTTQSDINAAQSLSKIAGVTDIKSFGIELKKQKASLKGKTASELVNLDFKEFSFNGKKVGISQIEVVELGEFESRKNEFVSVLQIIQKNKNYNAVFLMVTDIIAEGTKLIAVGNVAPAEKALAMKFENNELYAPKMLSRKKNLVPVLETVYCTRVEMILTKII